MTTYAKTGPFTDGSTTPPISGGFLNALEVSLEATSARADSSLQVTEAVKDDAASGAAFTISDPTVATIQRLVLTANCTLTFPTATPGRSFLVVLVQDATGSRTVTWPANVRWGTSGVPVLSTGANKLDIFSFVCIKVAGNWLAAAAGAGY